MLPLKRSHPVRTHPTGQALRRSHLSVTRPCRQIICASSSFKCLSPVGRGNKVQGSAVSLGTVIRCSDACLVLVFRVPAGPCCIAFLPPPHQSCGGRANYRAGYAADRPLSRKKTSPAIRSAREPESISRNMMLPHGLVFITGSRDDVSMRT